MRSEILPPQLYISQKVSLLAN